jgi:hypothetical protein
MESLLWGVLAYAVLPVWLLAGLCDYIVHARTDLARTSGVRESALHLLQTAEIGVPMLALLFLEVTATTLALMALGAIAHTVTAYRDIRYTEPLRYISPFEQCLHAFLIVLPLGALAIVIVLHWPAFMALLAMADAPRGAWALHWREPPFAPHVIAAVLGASLVFAIAPGLVEFVRAWRQRRMTAVVAGREAPGPGRGKG